MNPKWTMYFTWFFAVVFFSGLIASFCMFFVNTTEIANIEYENFQTDETIAENVRETSQAEWHFGDAQHLRGAEPGHMFTSGLDKIGLGSGLTMAVGGVGMATTLGFAINRRNHFNKMKHITGNSLKNMETKEYRDNERHFKDWHNAFGCALCIFLASGIIFGCFAINYAVGYGSGCHFFGNFSLLCISTIAAGVGGCACVAQKRVFFDGREKVEGKAEKASIVKEQNNAVMRKLEKETKAAAQKYNEENADSHSTLNQVFERAEYKDRQPLDDNTLHSIEYDDMDLESLWKKIEENKNTTHSN